MSNANELLTRAVANVIPRDLAEKKLASKKKLRIYLGIDPTGAKLHLGHSVPLQKLKAFADAGHHVIFLVGSFTAMIGDPSGRDSQREVMTRDGVENNFQTYKKQASKILDCEKDVEVRYNDEWLGKLSPTEFLTIAGHFTKQQLEQREMFVRREKEGNPIHMHEMLYPLLVGYDSVVLDVDCELGGSDQEFNMLCGRTLQKAFGKREKFVLTTRLIEGTDGRKMSKTYDNCIYLEDEPNNMYGKVMSLKDELIPTYMECCTLVPMAEVGEAAKALKGGKVNPKDLKMRLARELVTMYHGKAAAEKAEREFEKVFRDKGTPEDIPQFKAKKGMLLIDALVESKTVSSKSEARRLIEQGAIKVNDKPVTSVDAKVEEGIVKVGKRKFVKITSPPSQNTPTSVSD